MSKQKQTPAELVIESFQGVRPAARALNIEASAISRWQEKGLVPSKYQQHILKKAWDRGIDLTAHDLIFGRAL